MIQTYEIPEANLDALMEQVTTLGLKAAKLGMPPITIVAGERLFKAHGAEMVPYLVVTLSGEQPKLAGWSFAGTISHTPDGNIVRQLPGVVLDAKYATVAPWCDHCRLARKRSDSFVVRHEDGREKQVGRSCLGDFLGHANPHAIAKLAELLAAAVEACTAASTHKSGSTYYDNGHRVPVPAYVDLKAYLATVAAVIRTRGWVSRGTVFKNRFAGHGGPHLATADAALIELFKADGTKPTEGDFDTARRAIGWAEELEPKNEYEEVLVAATGAGSGAFLRAQAGVVASLIPTFQRGLDKTIANVLAAQAGTEPAHIGTVGKREVFALRLTLLKPYASARGQGVLAKWLDAHGCGATAFGPPGSGAGLTVGKIYKVAATVQKHGEYEGAKDTILVALTVMEEVDAWPSE